MGSSVFDNCALNFICTQSARCSRRAADFVRAWFIQVAIISNHQNGRDTHVRQIKVFSPRQDLVKAMGHEIGFTSAEFAPYAVVR